MNQSLLKLGAVLAATTGAMCALAADVPWQVSGGTASISINREKLEAEGFQIVNMVPTAFGNFPMENAIGFTVEKSSSFRFETEDHQFGRYLGGAVHVKGGFFVRYNGQDYPVFNMSIRANGSEPTSDLMVASRNMSYVPPTLELDHPLASFNIQSRRLTMGWADLRFSSEFLSQIGRPDLLGETFGCFSVEATTSPVQDPGNTSGGGNGNPEGTIDVTLWRLYGLQSMGRNGTAFPNGITGFACATTSANLGTSNILWYAPMDERHPVIVQNAYRIRNGRLEQIGTAFLKHGFLATNTPDQYLNNGQGSHPGTGALLGPNLTDTYGSGNNGDRYYLGARSEVNPFTGRWTRWGSLFDIGLPPNQTQPDGQRSFTGSGLPGHQHRIEVRDSDLNAQPNGTQFWYEAFYITAEDTVNGPDINTYNNIGVRQFTPSWSGSSWTVSNHNDAPSRVPGDPATSDNFYQMPMIQRWAQIMGGQAVANKALETSEGDAWVAVNPVNQGNGTWLYEVAVYNHNLDRQIRQVSIPIMGGLNVTNIGFRDSDWDDTNQWTGTYDSVNGMITWSTQTHAQNPNANSLKYGSVYNFWFIANAAPQSNQATLNLFKPRPTGSTLDNMTGNLVAPPNPNIYAASYAVVVGSNTSGNLSNLRTSDDQRNVITQSLAFDDIMVALAEIMGTAPVSDANKLDVIVESNADLDGRLQHIWLMNWNTNQWDLVDTAAILSTDTTRTVSITGASNVAKYVRTGTREVRMRTGIELGAFETSEMAIYRLDQARMKVSY